MEINKLEEIIKGHEKFVITTHANPDGDAIGSVIGFYHLLKSYGKEGRIISHSPLPEYLRFSDTETLLEWYSPEEHDEYISAADVVVCLDFNNLSRVHSMEQAVRASSAIKICIDHHQLPEDVFLWIYSDTLASSTCELVYRVIKAMNPVAFTRQTVQALYLGLVTDTGSFRFDRTTPEVHRMAADLIEKGADIMQVTRNIYEKGTLGRIKAIGEMITEMQIYGDNSEIAVIHITGDMLNRYDMSPEDTEGFEQYMMAINTVKVGVKVVDLKEGFKSSLRSKGAAEVHLIARRFGGGGHKNAAGIPKLFTPVEEFIKEIVEEIKKYLSESKSEEN
ncbi:MAG: exopolyphosphatase [Ignavibacteriales bacterium]